MQVKHRINMPKSGQWPRCKRVDLSDGVLRCELNSRETYVLVEAYRLDPHVEFANAITDQDLIDFTERWGPPFINPETPGVVELNFAKHQETQRCFAAVSRLLDAAKKAEGEREALLSFISAEEGLLGSVPGIEAEMLGRHSILRDEFHFEGPISGWVELATLKTVRATVDCMIPHLLFIPNVRLVCHRSAGRCQLEAEWNVYDLGAALQWMAWYDEFTGNPLLCCPGCRKVFRSPDGRSRKFCPGGKCAHRVTARLWQKEYNKQLREGKRK
jgi:hypothetical protein